MGDSLVFLTCRASDLSTCFSTFCLCGDSLAYITCWASELSTFFSKICHRGNTMVFLTCRAPKLSTFFSPSCKCGNSIVSLSHSGVEPRVSELSTFFSTVCSCGDSLVFLTCRASALSKNVQRATNLQNKKRRCVETKEIIKINATELSCFTYRRVCAILVLLVTLLPSFATGELKEAHEDVSVFPSQAVTENVQCSVFECTFLSSFR